jgi:hypothetical protein
MRKLLRLGSPSLTQTNRAFHQLLRDGVSVEYARPWLTDTSPRPLAKERVSVHWVGREP